MRVGTEAAVEFGARERASDSHRALRFERDGGELALQGGFGGQRRERNQEQERQGMG